uniref:EGF-like domain-containing protein n=1 Tax=Macrostomum lignano TaxID=282301 RepID=A0A1I8F5G5_9PLAT
ERTRSTPLLWPEPPSSAFRLSTLPGGRGRPGGTTERHPPPPGLSTTCTPYGARCSRPSERQAGPIAVPASPCEATRSSEPGAAVRCFAPRPPRRPCSDILSLLLGNSLELRRGDTLLTSCSICTEKSLPMPRITCFPIHCVSLLNTEQADAAHAADHQPAAAPSAPAQLAASSPAVWAAPGSSLGSRAAASACQPPSSSRCVQTEACGKFGIEVFAASDWLAALSALNGTGCDNPDLLCNPAWPAAARPWLVRRLSGRQRRRPVSCRWLRKPSAGEAACASPSSWHFDACPRLRTSVRMGIIIAIWSGRFALTEIDGFRCECRPGYNWNNATQICEPVCTRGCNATQAAFAPSRTFVPAYSVTPRDTCDVACDCNGHSNCARSVARRPSHLPVLPHNTRGSHCQFCSPLHAGAPPLARRACPAASNFSWIQQGPSIDDAVCMGCDGNTEGSRCEQCSRGNYRLGFKPPAALQALPVQRALGFLPAGHGQGCDCQNNTRTSCTDRDQRCARAAVRRCYHKMGVNNYFCLDYRHSQKACGVPDPPATLPTGRTLFFQTSFAAPADLYLALSDRTFVVNNTVDANGFWSNLVSIDYQAAATLPRQPDGRRRRRSVVSDPPVLSDRVWKTRTTSTCWCSFSMFFSCFFLLFGLVVLAWKARQAHSRRVARQRRERERQSMAARRSPCGAGEPGVPGEPLVTGAAGKAGQARALCTVLIIQLPLPHPQPGGSFCLGSALVLNPRSGAVFARQSARRLISKPSSALINQPHQQPQQTHQQPGLPAGCSSPTMRKLPRPPPTRDCCCEDGERDEAVELATPSGAMSIEGPPNLSNLHGNSVHPDPNRRNPMKLLPERSSPFLRRQLPLWRSLLPKGGFYLAEAAQFRANVRDSKSVGAAAVFFACARFKITDLACRLTASPGLGFAKLTKASPVLVAACLGAGQSASADHGRHFNLRVTVWSADCTRTVALNFEAPEGLLEARDGAAGLALASASAQRLRLRVSTAAVTPAGSWSPHFDAGTEKTLWTGLAMGRLTPTALACWDGCLRSRVAIFSPDRCGDS